MTLHEQPITCLRMYALVAKEEAPMSAIPFERLNLFGDQICVRDPRGRSPRPALVPCMGPTGRVLAIHGGFTVLQRFSITPLEGKAFVDTSKDANPIHTEDSVISGAMTAARLLILPEILVPSLQVKSFRIKFRAFSRYDRATVNRFTFVPNGDGGFTVDLAVHQQGVPVAHGTLKTTSTHALGAGETLPRDAGETAGRRKTLWGKSAPAPRCDAPADLICDWYRSLRMEPEHAFKYLGYGYPRAFLASLPSGEMVRQSGAPGLLNGLNLQFPESGIPALSQGTSPTVEVAPVRPRNSFRKVLANVASGMVTYCTGYATVLLT